jgi:hypothetical protein
MEKETKILLVLGAAVAAYLILKPKKAAAQTVAAPDQPVKVDGVPLPQKSNVPLTDRQTNVNNMFSTTDSGGVIRNPYSSSSNGTRFDDYVSMYNITQAEIDVAKSYYPNAPLTKSNYKVSKSAKPLIF